MTSLRSILPSVPSGFQTGSTQRARHTCLRLPVLYKCPLWYFFRRTTMFSFRGSLGLSRWYGSVMASITAFNSLFRGLAVEEVSQVRRTKAQILAKLDVRQAFVSASPGSLIYPRARNSKRSGYFSHGQQRLFSPCGEAVRLGAGLGFTARYREKIIPETNHGVLRIQFLTRRA